MNPDGSPYIVDGTYVLAPWEMDGTDLDAVYEVDENEQRVMTEPPVDGLYYAPMELFNVTIGQSGAVIGMNEWDEPITIGFIALANVPNANALENEGNGYFKAKSNTGVLTAREPGGGSTGLLTPGSLEMANVDLAQEFTDMITTQRGFQANGRIISVTDEMLAELVNLKR